MLGHTIGIYRKKLGLTQEQLAQKLEVTNQAVSKWEGDQCCPDVQLLPKLAQVLGLSMDALFGVEVPRAEPQLPWPDDGAFHIVLYCGHQYIGSGENAQQYSFSYEGPVKDIYCEVNLECEKVLGSVRAGGYVECGDVLGSVSAGDYVECGDVDGSVNAGNYVVCGDVGENVNAGNYVQCGDVGGNVVSVGCVDCNEAGGCVQGNSVYSITDEGITIEVDNGKKHHFKFNPFKKDR